MLNYFQALTLPIIMNNSIRNAQIELTLADLDCQLILNYLCTAKEYGLVESTLRRCYQGKTVSIEEAKSEYWQKLTSIQEDFLVEWINYLTDQAIPPTPQIVRNLAQEITKTCIGKD